METVYFGKVYFGKVEMTQSEMNQFSQCLEGLRKGYGTSSACFKAVAMAPLRCFVLGAYAGAGRPGEHSDLHGSHWWKPHSVPRRLVDDNYLGRRTR